MLPESLLLLGSLFAEINPLDSSLIDLMNALPPVTIQERNETTKKKIIEESLNSRAITEDSIQELAIKAHLNEKGYQLFRDAKGSWIIHDRHSIFKTLYPSFFSEFEKRTDEKQRTIDFLAQFIQQGFTFYPPFCQADTFKLYDMGIGSGQITAQLLQTLKQVLPKERRLCIYGVDNKPDFVNQASLKAEKIADQISIALGDLNEDLTHYQLLDGEPARHDELHDVNVILFSHVGYYIKSSEAMAKIIREMMQLSAQTTSPLFCFIHVTNENPIHKMLVQKKFSFLKPRNKDIQFFIRSALENAGLPLVPFSYYPKLHFPLLNDQEWDELTAALLSFSKNDFQKEIEVVSQLSPDLEVVWKLILLWLQDLFAAFEQEERKLIIDEYKSLLNQYPEGVPISNTAIFSSVDALFLDKLSQLQTLSPVEGIK